MAVSPGNPNWHSLSTEQAVEQLRTDPDYGLTQQEVAIRLERHGYNRLTTAKGPSPLGIFFGQFNNLLIIVLMIAVVLSAVVGEVVDALIIAVIVVFCAVLGFVQEYRAERALAALKTMLSPTISVLRDGRAEEVLSEELVPGDILLLKAGDKIPADARLLETHSLRCEEAPLTGESTPVAKRIEALAEPLQIGDRRNMVFAGTTVVHGRGKASVTSTAMETEFGKIAEGLAVVESEKTPLEKRTGEVGKWLGLISLGVCLVVVAVGLGRAGAEGELDLSFGITMVIFAVALAVAAIPEALAAVVTGALAIGMHQMAQKKALVRKMPAVETLGCTTVICSDKTGTLTKGEMTVRKIYTGGQLISVGGVGYEPQGDFLGWDASRLATHPTMASLLHGSVLCSDAVLETTNERWTIRGDPTEGALVVSAVKAGIDHHQLRLEMPRVEEIPFSSERKCMTTLHRMPDGRIRAFLKGAPEVVLEKCDAVLNAGGIDELSPPTRAEILHVNEQLALEGLRVLGLAYRDINGVEDCTEESVECEMVFLGLSGMIDPPRDEALAAIETCRQVGIKPIMITGDHRLTAQAIASEMSIYHEGDLILSGEELDLLTEEELADIVEKVTVYARVSPMDKLKIVKAWKAKGDVVAMTGDGVNDAPALKYADIGIAMGITGTEVTKEASDMVLSDDNFATIVHAIERGRWIYDNIKKYLAYLVSCNITEVAVIGGVVLVSGPRYLPLLPAAILYMNLATDGLPALALGVAPPDPDIMQRPPRDPRESVFTRDVQAMVLRAVVIEIPLFLLVFYLGFQDIQHARTEIFFLFIVVELLIALNFRSMTYSILKAPPHKWLILAIVWEVLLLAFLVQFPFVRNAFGIGTLSLGDMGVIVGLALLVFAAMEATKALLRRWERPPQETAGPAV